MFSTMLPHLSSFSFFTPSHFTSALCLKMIHKRRIKWWKCGIWFWVSDCHHRTHSCSSRLRSCHFNDKPLLFHNKVQQNKYSFGEYWVRFVVSRQQPIFTLFRWHCCSSNEADSPQMALPVPSLLCRYEMQLLCHSAFIEIQVLGSDQSGEPVQRGLCLRPHPVSFPDTVRWAPHRRLTVLELVPVSAADFEDLARLTSPKRGFDRF